MQDGPPSHGDADELEPFTGGWDCPRPAPWPGPGASPAQQERKEGEEEEGGTAPELHITLAKP